MRTEAGLYALSRVVFPDADFMGAPELFYRMETAASADGSGRPCRRVSFGTWMNLFAARKWYRYCALGRLFLRVRARGWTRLHVTGHSFTAAFGVTGRALAERTREPGSGADGEILVEIPDPGALDGVSFRLEFPLGGACALEGMEWCTDAPPQRKCRIAIVTCTYRRERYVEKTVRKFRDFLAEDPARGDAFHLFVVDNGRTLDPGLGDAHATILPNRNAGGAGGFCRGLMAANDGGFTHCLFMDDDVEIFPESFSRTLALVEYFREEHRDDSVNGPMMNLYDKTEMFENLAAYDGAMGFPPCRAHVRADSVARVLECIDIPPGIFREKWVHSAWWYTCCSLRRYRDEYPVPVFFRGDDMEWSWRKRGMEIVSVNGVCIWHAPFQWRVGRLADCYYLPRNMLVLAMLHQEGNEADILEALGKRLGYLLTTLDYVGAEVFLAAIRDVLQGHRCLMEDPEEQMRRIRAICGKAAVRRDVPYTELEQAGKRAWKKGQERDSTLDWYPPERDFKGKEKVHAYNLSLATCETRERDDARARRLEAEGQGLLHLLSLQYRLLREDMQKGYAVFRTRAFWDRYLGLVGSD